MKIFRNQSVKHHEFLNPLCLPRTIANFLPRRAILDALTSHLGDFRGTILDLGCGRMPYKPLLLAPPSHATKYIGLDLRADVRLHTYNNVLPDLEWDGSTIPLESNSVESVVATEVLFQCEDVETVMREVARVLVPGGLFFYTVPFLWAIHDFPSDQYRFTPFSLERHLRNAGFEHVRMQALGGWDSSLAQMIGLWIGRRPMNRVKRGILSAFAVPVVRYLIKQDVPPRLPFEFEGTIMITGIAGTALKPHVAERDAHPLSYGSESHEAG
jgi:SAM-dependent methyltransferase